MNSEKQYVLLGALKQAQKELLDKAQNDKIVEWARDKALDNAKILLKAILVIESM